MKSERKHLLPRLSVDRPVTIIMVLTAILVVGAIAYTRIPLNLLPSGMERPQLWVSASYPNASPLEVEQKIAKPLEEAVATVSRVGRIESGSYNGYCWVRIEFLKGTNMKEAFAELKDRMDRAMPELPEEVVRIRVRRWDENDIEVIWGAFTFEGDFADRHFVLDTYVEPALRRIEGVGNVNIWGGRSPQVVIDVDQDKVLSHRVNLFEMVGKLRSQNLTVPGGSVLEGGRKIYVRSLGKYQTVEEIRNIVIKAEGRVRLADVAKVEFKRPKRDWIYRIDGKGAMGFEVMRNANANMVNISTEVRQTLDELSRHPKLQGIGYQIFFDQGKFVTQSVDNLKASGLWGGLFAAMVLFFFLRAVRMTAIITLAIPLSLLITVVFLYFIGWSLNMATMMGLMLSLGLVVDNAIVIVENIYRKRQEGAAPRLASIEGAGEVGLAITMATLTTVVVFLPLMLMSGEEDMAFWMLRIGLPVIIGLLASLLIALIFIPLAAQRLSTKAVREKEELGFILWVRRFYVRSLTWVLGHRTDAFILVLAVMATVQIPMDGLQRADKKNNERRDLRLRFQMPTGQVLAEADVFMSGVEDTLLNHKEAYNLRALRTDFNGQRGYVNLILNEEKTLQWYQVAYEELALKVGWIEKKHLAYKEIEEDIKKRLIMPPGVSMEVNRGGGSADAQLSISLYGENTWVLMNLAQEVERRLGTIPGLLSVRTDMDRAGSELQVRLNRNQIERYGINPQTVSGSISYGIRGVDVNRYQSDDGREVIIRLQFEEGDRRSMQQLRTMTFPTAEGVEVPLESLASLSVSRTLGRVRRYNRQTSLTVTARANKDDSKALFAQVDQAMQGFEMPRGYRWDKGARFERLAAQDNTLKFAVVMSVTCVFLLMGVLFESFVLPLSVIVSIPFAFFGVYWVLYLTGTVFEVMASIGCVILIGVVVNNAIVLIDLANRLRDEGLDRTQALIKAGTYRFRPILMTSFTTIFGLIPMAAGNSKMIGISYAPLGRTMMGGLLSSMVLTLILVPLFYTYFDDLRELVQRMVNSAFGRRGQEVQEG